MNELTNRDTAKRTNTPPLQGRGKGWGLSANTTAGMQTNARTMRNQPSEPELRLWQALRGSQLGGFKFRRQAVIGGTPTPTPPLKGRGSKDDHAPN
jgi:hypothetical protein